MKRWMQTSQPQYLGELFDVCKNRSRGNTESAQAFQAIKDRLTVDQKRVLSYIKQAPNGLTLDAIAAWMNRPPNAISGRITELKIKGKIERCGTRPTRSGCSAAVWKAV